MSDRLDRIEAQQETNTANIADLITLSSNLLQSAEGAVTLARESETRFETLRNEAIADRQRSDQRFNAQQEIIQSLLLALQRNDGTD